MDIWLIERFSHEVKLANATEALLQKCQLWRQQTGEAISDELHLDRKFSHFQMFRAVKGER